MMPSPVVFEILSVQRDELFRLLVDACAMSITKNLHDPIITACFMMVFSPLVPQLGQTKSFSSKI
jgi:hypothetical protein